jgi:hypothetical protein
MNLLEVDLQEASRNYLQQLVRWAAPRPVVASISAHDKRQSNFFVPRSDGTEQVYFCSNPPVVEDGPSTRAVTAAERLTARLDRLPMTRTLWIMAILLTFGGFFDGYAIGLIGALGPGLFKAKIFTPTTVGFFGMAGFASFIAALFAGLFVASLFVSYIADLDQLIRRHYPAFREPLGNHLAPVL